MELDPLTWCENENYKHGLRIAGNLRVVNGCSERGVKLISDYNNILTKKEDQKQYIVQILEDHRKRYPDCKRKTLLNITK